MEHWRNSFSALWPGRLCLAAVMLLALLVGEFLPTATQSGPIPGSMMEFRGQGGRNRETWVALAPNRQHEPLGKTDSEEEGDKGDDLKRRAPASLAFLASISGRPYLLLQLFFYQQFTYNLHKSAHRAGPPRVLLFGARYVRAGPGHSCHS